MLVKTKGVVLNRIKYADNASIVAVYTQEFGRMSFVVKGMNSKKSKLRSALLQVLSIVEIDLNYNPNKEIQYIKELRVAVAFDHIPYDPIKTSLALFMAEMMNKVLSHPAKDEDLFLYLEQAICQLDKCQVGLGNFHLVFLSGLAKQMGFTPELFDNGSDVCFDLLNGVFVDKRPYHLHYIENEAAKNFKALMLLDFDHMDELKLTQKQRAVTLDHFLEFFKLHVPGFISLKSVEVMYKIWD